MQYLNDMSIFHSEPNIAFKGTRLGEEFSGSRVSSMLGFCSDCIVGVPLNLTLERSSSFDSVGRIGKILAQGSYHPCYFFPVKLSFA